MTIQIEKYIQKNRHRDTIVKLQYSPTGRFLVSADRSGEIIIWPEGKSHGAQHVCSPYSSLTGVWFSENEEWLLVGHQDGHLLIYELPKMKLEADVQLKTDRPNGYILSGTSRSVLDWVVLAVCPSNNPDLYAILEFRDFFAIHREGFQVRKQTHLSGPLIEYTTASPDGRFVFFVYDLGYIYRFRLPEMRLDTFAVHHEIIPAVDLGMRPTTKDHASGIAGIVLSRDCKLLASTSRTGGVQIWHTGTERQDSVELWNFRPFAAKEQIRSGWIRGVSFLPNSTALVLGADDGTVEVWDYKSGQVTHTAKCPSSVRSLDVSPDGSQLAIGCEDGSIFLVPWGGSYHQAALKIVDKTPDGRLASLINRLKEITLRRGQL